MGKLTPDLDMARRHLLLLDEDAAEFTFQTFPDSKKGGLSLACSTGVLRGTLDEYAAEFTRLQARGAGVFVVVNRGGRTKAQITHARAIWREDDTGGLPPLPLEPHFVIQTSPGKHHEYLLIEPSDDLDTTDAIMERMVEDYGSDPQAKDRSRVLRLAGFYHLKDPAHPHLVKIIHEGGGLPYTLEKVAESIPPLKKSTKAAARVGETIIDGARDATLTSLAGTMRRRGFSEAAILAALRVENQEKCSPPLPDSELQKIARSVAQYEPTITPDDDYVFKAAFEGQKGGASLFIRLNKNRFCFDHASGVWHTWRTHYWEREPLGEPLKAVDAVAELFRGAAARCKGEIIVLGQTAKSGDDRDVELKATIEKLQARQKACLTQVSNLNSLGYRKQVIEFAAQGPGSLGITGEEWDLHPWLLPCANGVVDLKSAQIRPGAPEDYLKTICPTPYSPDAACARWEQTLYEIFDGQKELISFYRRLLGAAIVGAAIEHILPVLHGIGRNGKDTTLEAVSHVLGDLAGPVQSELLLEQGRARSSAGPSADIMALRGRRIAWASETNEGRKLDSGRVKLLTGGGALVGRPPFGRREISFPQSYTLFLLTNARPHVNSDDYALWKRLLLIPFGISFVDDPQAPHERRKIPNMADTLRREAPGILAWLVRGCLAWQREGLNPPEIVKVATEDYREDEDLLLRFIEDSCEVHHDAEVGAALLYQAYTNWSAAMNIKPMSGTAFGRKMSVRYQKAKGRLGAFYTGLKLAL